MKWYSLFSHTGKELENIINKTQVTPEAIITTNADYDGPLQPIVITEAKKVNDWLVNNVEPHSIITLNGYMRIIPEEILEYLYALGCDVYNIHPAPIHLYPDLVGKDPQERLYEGLQSGKYKYIGNVIHAVDGGVDTGLIFATNTILASALSMSKEAMYAQLHDSATDLWIQFLKAVEVINAERS